MSHFPLLFWGIREAKNLFLESYGWLEHYGSTDLLLVFFSLMSIAYIKIETEPRIGQFLQAALLLPAGKRPKKAKKPDCVPIWWLSGHITAKKSQIWLDISQISSTFEQLQLARAAAAALCAPSKRQIWPYMALLRR